MRFDELSPVGWALDDFDIFQSEVPTSVPLYRSERVLKGGSVLTPIPSRHMSRFVGDTERQPDFSPLHKLIPVYDTGHMT